MIVQRFFGDQLLRDQINFVSDVMFEIVDANKLAEKYLIKRDPNTMEIALPRLIAFKTIQRMRFHRDDQAKIREKELENMKLLGATNLTYKESEQPNSTMLNVSASGTKNNFGLTLQPSKMSKVTVN